MHILPILAFSSAPPRPSRATPAQGFCEHAKANRLLPRQVSTQLTDFFKISQNPPRASGAWRHSHLLAPFPTSGYCDISEWHVRSSRARAWTPALMLHLSNPCTEPKGSQPNYPPKSFGHYITSEELYEINKCLG